MRALLSLGKKLIRAVTVGGATVCVMVTFFDRIGHPAVISGNSMQPTLNGADARWWRRDWVWLSTMRLHRPVHGEILTFISPREPTKRHIKRVSALENELVKCFFLAFLLNILRPKFCDELFLVPRGCVWMESDNPQNANDSNVYGPVNLGLVQGRATRIIWPPERWRAL